MVNTIDVISIICPAPSKLMEALGDPLQVYVPPLGALMNALWYPSTSLRVDNVSIDALLFCS
jgi:hypothetical protein